MCLNKALAKCKTEEERQQTLNTYSSMINAVAAEDDGDPSAFCRMSGKHGSWIKVKTGWLCASCSIVYSDKDNANEELLAQNHQWRTNLDTEMISCDRCGRDERMSYADKHKGEKCNGL